MFKKCSFTLRFFILASIVVFSACSHNSNNSDKQSFLVAAPEWVNGSSLGNNFYAVGMSNYNKELKQTINDAEKYSKSNLKTMIKNLLNDYVDENLQKFNDAKRNEFKNRLNNLSIQTAENIDYNNVARRDEIWIDPETNKMYVFMVVDDNFVFDGFKKQANQIKDKYHYDEDFKEFVDEVANITNDKVIYKKSQQKNETVKNNERQKINNFSETKNGNDVRTNNLSNLIDEF